MRSILDAMSVEQILLQIDETTEKIHELQKEISQPRIIIMAGKKLDQGKPKLSLLTKESLEAETRAFEFGAQKYGRDNYKAGMEWTRLVDAALRHLTAWNQGESTDIESNLSHLAHAKACLAMLIYYEVNKVGKDDRYKKSLDIACPIVQNVKMID